MRNPEAFFTYHLLSLCPACIRLAALPAAFFLSVAILPAQPVRFKPQMIAAESFESAAVFDVNNDRQPDIVSGAFWYEGPGFVKRHFIGPPKRYGEYYDDFSTIPMDVNGDGRTDFVTGGWWGSNVRWRKNPGNGDEWPEHEIGQCGNVETTRAWDVDGDGHPEIVPNTPGKPLRVYQLLRDDGGKANGQFKEYILAPTQGHGLGFGDVNGDGRGDFILSNGWLEAPAKPFAEKWTLHPEFDLKAAGVPILVTDVDGDGKNDLIVGQGHDYGLDWYSGQTDRKGKRTWTRHPIDPFSSQYHTMAWVDLDGDGQPELVSGKRYRAHDDKDPGAHDPAGLYYFKWNGENFTKTVISYGPPGQGKGTGIYFQAADLRGTGRQDIVVAGKDGLWVFFNEGVK